MYGVLADLTVAVHVAYVAFVVGGEALVLAGWWRGWAWARNFWFRAAHLAAIGAVVVVELLGVRCPLTVWEEALRARAGQPVTGETFMSRLMHSLLYLDAPPWAFTAGHLAAGAVVLATFLLYPPRFPRIPNRRADMRPDQKSRPNPPEDRSQDRAGDQSGGGPAAEHHAAIPPAPPGEMPEQEVRKTRAVAEALARLGPRADPAAVAAEVKTRTGIELGPEEVATIQAELKGTPVESDEPPRG